MSSPQRGTNGDTSRSGRIRKPKVFYDLSDIGSKRRSMPNIESVKPNKIAKIEVASAPAEVKKPPKITPEKCKKVPASISIRRKTICTSKIFKDDIDDNGCIVCDRGDIKKGRFVNCIGCDKRGHFTCLRNNKLFKTADQENNWQCPSCKVCDYCCKLKPNEQLYKCILCNKSYHLHCSSKISPLPKNVVKKKFTCGNCTKGSSMFKSSESLKSLIPNRKSDGFPGFAHDETTKTDTKSDANAKVKKIATLPKKRKASSPLSIESEPRRSVDLDMKIENPSPLPETDESFEMEMANANAKKISVRTDLVQSVKLKSEDDKMEIQYDTKTIVKPHESIPDVRKWDCDEVYIYFMGTAPEYAQLLKENQIDGDALLLIKRDDVLNRFNLKLGSALRLHAQIVSLQYKSNNPIFSWNEF